MINRLKFFDEIHTQSREVSGVLLINDISDRSDFMFADWGISVLRPNSVKCLNDITEAMCDVSGPVSRISPYLEEVAVYASDKLRDLNRDTFFMVVSFDLAQADNFSLAFSKTAKASLSEPILKNFSVSGQKFSFSLGQSNTLFNRMEALISNISCFELKFSSSNTSSVQLNYPVERVFEETLIFSNLAIAKKI